MGGVFRQLASNESGVCYSTKLRSWGLRQDIAFRLIESGASLPSSQPNAIQWKLFGSN
jgi:hypothetical protein